MAISGRAYVDRPIADLHAAGRVAEAAASLWGLQTPELLRNGMNAIFVAGPTVIRVGTPNADPAASLALAAMLLEAGLRVNKPASEDVLEADGMAATAWERLERFDKPIDWEEVGQMVRRVHQIDRDELPPAYPLPSPVSFPWWDFDALLDSTALVIDDAAREGIAAAIARHPSWRDFLDPVVCHGDIHPGNVIMSTDGPVLIDWDLLCMAPPGWDHAPMMTWADRWGGPKGDYESLATGYGRSLRGDDLAEAFAELRLVAATLMRVKAGMTNESAMPEAQRRLRYWRGERDAPPWQAQ
jgi:aminoglycoside phosphotransferase (APT) family kinase protein